MSTAVNPNAAMESDLRYRNRAAHHADTEEARDAADRALRDRDARDRAIELLRDFNIAMVSTRRLDGTFGTRPMFCAQVDSDGTMWLVTRQDARLVEEIEAHDRVAVALSGGGRYVSVNAVARCLDEEDVVRGLWASYMEPFFPEGPAESDAVAVRLRPDEIEFWDTSGSNGARMLWNAAKAYLTGDEVEQVESAHAKVDLRN